MRNNTEINVPVVLDMLEAPTRYSAAWWELPSHYVGIKARLNLTAAMATIRTKNAKL